LQGFFQYMICSPSQIIFALQNLIRKQAKDELQCITFPASFQDKMACLELGFGERNNDSSGGYIFKNNMLLY
jgi:hypothetical protein